MRTFGILFFVFLPHLCSAQFDTLKFIDNTAYTLKGDTLFQYTKAQRYNSKGESVFMVVEQPATFPGGMQSLTGYLTENIVVPSQAIAKQKNGIVKATFTIDKRGIARNIQVAGDTTLGRGKEAIRLVSQMPRWKPAFQHGITRPMRLTLPISFNLESTKSRK